MQADAPVNELFGCCCACNKQHPVNNIVLMASPGTFQALHSSASVSVASEGCVSAAQVNEPLERAFHLLPWLVSGTLAVTLAQVLKADLAKGWAAWLQALIAIGVGVGALAVTWGYMEQVLPLQ